jgi:serine/threonine protein kinase
LLYELCTLNRPFSTLEKILKPDPEYRPVDEEEYRQELRDLIDDCLTSDPSARPTVDQILERPFLVAFSEEFDK